MKGTKLDGGKTRWTLMPWAALRGVIRVLEFGVLKYGENNWRAVSDGERRYRDAAYRHLTAIDSGETSDPESGLHHYDHALCSLIFARWHHIKSRGAK